MELHRRRGEQQHSVDLILEIIGKPVRQGGMRVTVASPRAADPVGFVEDRQVPMRGKNLLSPLRVGRERQRAQNVVVLVERILTATTKVLCRLAVDDREGLVELGAQLILPLYKEACRCNDQDTLDQTTGSKLL